MKIFPDCIPCFVRQAAEAVKMSGASENEQTHLLCSVLRWIGEIDLDQSSPAILQIIYRRLRCLLPTDDPYRAVKDSHNALAQALTPAFKRQIDAAYDPLTMAVRFAITGNMIDMGTKNSIGFGDIYDEMQSAPMQPIFGGMEAFKKAAAQARHILYLADNAGEIFFDRLLIEQLSNVKITLAVRGAPVINDATRFDALAAGLEEITEIIDNGSDAPGTLLADCSSEFQRTFETADMIIAKGQGNYETLNEVDQNIFFLHKTKCPIISTQTGFALGSYVAVNLFQQQNIIAERGIQ